MNGPEENAPGRAIQSSADLLRDGISYVEGEGDVRHELFTHLVLRHMSGYGAMYEVEPDEAMAIVGELVIATKENRPAAVVVHPLNGEFRGSEMIFVGQVIEAQRLTFEQAERYLKKADEEQNKSKIFRGGTR